MEIPTQITKTDYLNFLLFFYYKRNLAQRIIFPFLLVLLCSYNLTYKIHYHFLPIFLLVFLILAAIVFIFWYALPFMISKWRISKRFKSGNSVEKRTFLLAGHGIETTANNKNTFVSWQDIKVAGKTESFIFLRLYNKDIYLIPLKSFLSSIHEKTFFNEIHTQVECNKEHNVNRMYAKGWFGLIPLIGFFVGIWLIVESISKYKDKKLLSIGIASMLFTVIIYSSMIYYFRYSEQFRRDYAPFSKEYLTSLVSDIEFYKSQKGYYPDSLEELSSINKIVIINDPILNTKNGPNSGKFYYKKLGDKYTLFSCGIDKIPNTADDIFPALNNLDTSKIGFIRPK